MNVLKSAFACLAAIFLAAPAGAKTIDPYGVVVFTQADVNAGGITPGDTPGFPASILVSGSYRLASPLTLTSLKNGIVISAPSVNLDLGGFKISGGGVGRNGIVSEQRDATISNGIIRSFTENGIIAGGDFLTVNRVSSTNNGADGIGFYAGTGKNMRVSESQLSGNQSGIACGSGCSVQNSTIVGNQNGVSIAGGGLVLGNVIKDNVRIGISSSVPATGYGNNSIVNNGAGQLLGSLQQLQANSCEPACP